MLDLQHNDLTALEHIKKVAPYDYFNLLMDGYKANINAYNEMSIISTHKRNYKRKAYLNYLDIQKLKVLGLAKENQKEQ